MDNEKTEQAPVASSETQSTVSEAVGGKTEAPLIAPDADQSGNILVARKSEPIDSGAIDGNNAVKKFNRRIENNSIWNIICEHTCTIEIDEEAGFSWPQQRRITEPVVDQLLEKRILFIRSTSEDWLLGGVQRLACILQSGTWFKNLLIRITRNNIAYGQPGNKQLEFGFWNRHPRLHNPVVVFISADRADFIQKFFNHRKETVATQLIPELKKLNLFLVCEIDETDPEGQTFSTSKPWIHDMYAFWKIPALELELNQKFGPTGHQVFQQLSNGILKSYNERLVHEELVKRNYKSPEELLENIQVDIDEAQVRATGIREKLISHLKNDEDFIGKLVIFCGAFFSGINFSDFYVLVHRLLGDEVKEIKDVDSPRAIPLAEIWRKECDRYMSECMLMTKNEEGNQRVQFIAPRLAREIADYIAGNQYAFFFRVYQNFNQSELLAEAGINEKFESAIIEFFSLAARLDINNHNAVWLKNVVHRIWHEFIAKIPQGLSYDEFMHYFHVEHRHADFVFNRIPNIINGLLEHSNREYREIIDDFFNLLLDEKDAKKIAIVIASRIYRRYRHTNTFDTTTLMNYFKRTLNEAKWEDSFFAYDMLQDSMGYVELRDEVYSWLDDPDVSGESRTSLFGHLYLMDFILVTFYRFFRLHNAKKEYELLEEMKADFPESFKGLVKRLLSDKAVNSLEKILENDNNAIRFELYAQLFEGIETDLCLTSDGKLSHPHNMALSFVATILEIWFYILCYKSEPLKPSTPVDETWKKYTNLITEAANAKLLLRIKKCWMSRFNFYTTSLKHLNGGVTDRKNKSTARSRKQLQKRQSCLHMLIHLIQNHKPV